MSNTVDNRVVEMRIDHKQFDEGVKQTIDSLNSLEKALQINTDSVNLNNLQNQMNRMSFKNIEDNLNSLTNAFTGVGRVGYRVFDELISKGISLAETIGRASIGQVITGGKGRAQKVADARFKLEGLLKDADKVQSAFDSASKAVDGTAYGLDAAVSTASQLAASQVALGDDMDTALRGVAGLAAMTGSSFEDMGNIFATVAGNGRLMGMQLTQIATRGINVAATLADYLNITESEVRELVSKGEISFSTFSAAMNDAFGDQAAKANETLTGSLQNVQAALSRIGEIFYSGIIENKELIAFVNDLRVSLNAVKKSMEPLKKPFADLISSISILGSSLLKVFDTSGFSVIVNKVAKIFVKLSDVIKGLTERVNNLKLSNNFSVPTAVLNNVKMLNSTTQKIFNVLSKAIVGIKSFYEDFKTIIRVIGEAFRETFSFEGVGDFVKMLINSFNNLAERFKLTDERSAKLKNTFKGLFSIINILSSFIYYFAKTVGKLLIPVFEKVGDGLLIVSGFIGKYVSKFNDFLKKHNIFSRISNKIIDVLAKLKAYILAFVDAIKNNTAFSNFINIIKDIATSIYDKVMPAAKGAGDAVSEFGDKVKNVDTSWITNFVNTIASGLQKLTEKIQKYKDKIVDTISGIINKFKELTKPKKDTKSLAESVSENSKEASKDVEESVDNVISPFQLILDLASKIFDKAKEVFFDFVDTFVEKIKALTPEQIGILGISSAIMLFVLSLRGISKSVSKFLGSFGKIGESISKTIDTVKASIEDFKKDKQRSYNLVVLQTLAAILAILALSLYKLAQIDTSKLIITAGVLAALMGVVVSMANAIAKFGQKIEGFKEQMLMADHIRTMSKFLLVLSAVILILAFALDKVSKINTEDIWVKIAAFSVLIAEILVMSIALSKLAPKLSEGTGSLIAFAGIILILATSLALLSKMDTTDVIKSAIAMAIALVALGGALVLAGINADKIKFSSLLAMVLIISVIATALIGLGLIQKIGGHLISAALAMTIVLGALVGAFVAMRELNQEGKKSKDYKAVAILATLAQSLLSLALAIAILSNIEDYAKLAVSVAAILVIMYVVVKLMEMIAKMPSVSIIKLVTLGSMLFLLLAIAASLKLLLSGEYKWQDMLAAAGAIAGVLIAVVGALSVLSLVASSGVGAGAILVAMAGIFVTLLAISTSMAIFSSSLLIFSNSLAKLLSLDYSNFGNALKSLALLGIVVSFIGVALIPAGIGLVIFSAGMLALSAALLIVGTAIVKILGSLTAFIAAITILGNNGGKISKGLTTVSKSIRTVIIEILSAIATGIVRGTQILATNGLLIAANLGVICSTLLSIVGMCLSTIIDLVVDSLILLLQKIDTKLPKILTSVGNIIVKLLRFLALNVDVFAYYGTYIIVGLITGILDGLTKKLPDVTESITNFTLTAINAFVDTLYANQDNIRDALRGFIDVIALTFLNIIDELTGGWLSSSKITGEFYQGVMDELGAEIEEIQGRNAERQAKRETDAYIKQKEKDKQKLFDANKTLVYDTTDQTAAAEQGANATASAYTGAFNTTLQNQFSNGGISEDLINDYIDIDPNLIDTSSAEDVGEKISTSTATGVENNREILNTSFEGMYSKQVEEMKKAGWHEEMTDEGKVLVRDISTGVENGANEGLLDKGIKVVTGLFGDAGSDIGVIGEDGGKNWLTGLISGMSDPTELSNIDATIEDVTNRVSEKTSSGLQEESPSKLSAKFGVYWIEGLANGLNESHEMLYRAASNISDVLITSMSAAVGSASDVIDDNMNLYPTITPIIDGNSMMNARNVLNGFSNPTTFKMAADSQLSVHNSAESQLANQVAALQASVDKLANQDFEHMMDGVQINVNNNTTLDGKQIGKHASNYTIADINRKEEAMMMAMGGRY